MKSKYIKNLDAEILELQEAISNCSEEDIQSHNAASLEQELNLKIESRKNYLDTVQTERLVKDWSGVASGIVGLVGIVIIAAAEKSEILSSKGMNIAQKLLGK